MLFLSREKKLIYAYRVVKIEKCVFIIFFQVVNAEENYVI